MTLADAESLGLATLVAVTVTTCPGAGTPGVATSAVCGSGAVKTPFVLTVPTSEFPPAVPFTDQVTAVLLVPLTVAVNGVVWPAPNAKAAEVGETLMETAAVAFGDSSDVVVLLPQAKSKQVSTNRIPRPPLRTAALIIGLSSR
jgi:hypothetical protein